MSKHRFNYKWYLKDGYPQKNGLKVFGTFICGGGSTMGYKLAGFEHLGGVEIDPQVADVYKTNHNPKYLFVEDIREFANRTEFPEDLYDLDILDGSPPCSSFSMAGNREKDWGKEKVFREGQAKQRLDDLFFDYIKLAKKLQPKVVIAENVKGLVSMKDVFEVIKKDFKNTGKGYRIYAKELFAPDYGIPQSRKRIFFIGISEEFIKRNKLNLTEEDLFPDIEFAKTKNKYPKAKFFFKDLKEPELENNDLSQMYYSKAKYTKGTQGQIEVNENGIAPTIRSEHHGNIEFRFLNKKNGGKNINPKNKQRRLTIRECARIQTFPDNLKFVFDIGSKEGIAASDAYKLIGDAVPPLLAYKIAKKIEKIIIRFL
jgi:DNA (cytosine-5)-methyltransferase 1